MIRCSIPIISAFFAACAPPPPLAVGYIEGDYVLVASSGTARIEAVHVARGDRIELGAILVALETSDAGLQVAQAVAAHARAQSELANLQ